MTAVERVPVAVPLTPHQARVMQYLSDGLTYWAIARLTGASEFAVRRTTQKVASRIPGDLPVRDRCVVWWRGATLAVLMGVPQRHLPPDERSSDFARTSQRERAPGVVPDS